MQLLKKILTIYHVWKNKGRKPGCIQEVDNRNYLGKNLAGDISAKDLVNIEFSNATISELIDQKYTDFCVACGSAYASEATEGKPMSWAGMYKIYCKYIGYVPGYGASILKVLMAKTKYGIPERQFDDFKAEKGRNWNADPANLSIEALNNASFHKSQSVWEANRPYGWDRFDCFRAWLWKFHDKKIVIQTGVDSHNVTIIGQKKHPITGELCLYGPDSYGTQSLNYRIGKSIDGWRYWSRAEANQLPTGNFVFDIPVDLAKLLNTYNEKAIKTADKPDCYIVRNGQKHSLVNEIVALSNNCLMYDPNNVYIVSQEEFDAIPTGEPVKFRDGKNWALVQRILELLNKLDVLKNL